MSDGCDHEGALDLSFGIAKQLETRVMEILAEEIQSQDFPDNFKV